MYVKQENEERYIVKSKEILEQMNKETRMKALKAIEDLFSDETPFSITWEFIANALTKKSVSNYEVYGFGILFNRNFVANVNKQIERNREVEQFTEEDFEDFFSGESDSFDLKQALEQLNSPKDKKVYSYEDDFGF